MTEPPQAPIIKAEAAPGSAAGPALLVRAAEAARLCGVSLRGWWGLHSSGRTPLPTRLGGRTLWRRAELEAWTAAGCPSRERWQAMKGGSR